MPSQYDLAIRNASTISGTDVVIYLENTQIIAARSITLNVTRNKQPLYVHGTANPVGFSRGPRLISGVIESALVYKYNIAQWFLNKMQSDDYGHYALTGVRDLDVLKNQYRQIDGTAKQIVGATITAAKYRPLFLDELPPIDITVVGVNELGRTAVMRIYGVEFTDYTVTTAVENTVNAETIRFLAMYYDPWTMDTLWDGGGLPPDYSTPDYTGMRPGTSGASTTSIPEEESWSGAGDTTLTETTESTGTGTGAEATVPFVE